MENIIVVTDVEVKNNMAELNDVGAERAVLAGLVQYGIDAYVLVSDIINHETFDHANNQILYKCIEKIIQNDQSVDIASILSAASQLGFSESINTTQ